MKRLGWLVGLKGLIAIILSVLIWTDLLVQQSLVVALLIIFEGLFSLSFCMKKEGEKNIKLLFFLEAFVTLSIGSFIIFFSSAEKIPLTLFAIVWLTYNGFSQIILSQILSAKNKARVPILINGIYGFSLGIIMISSLWPLTFQISIIVGFSLLIFGIFSEFIAYRLQCNITK